MSPLKSYEDSQRSVERAGVKREQRRPGKKASRGISPASSAQRAKIKAMGACVVLGSTEGVDGAHVWPRGLGGCDSPDCVIPLHRELHNLLDRQEIDILGILIAHGLFVEIAHPILAHNVSPLTLLERLTGLNWQPIKESP